MSHPGGFCAFPRSAVCGKKRRNMIAQEAHSRITPKLVDSLYTDAMLLADEARAYFDRSGREDRMALDPLIRVGFSCESLKVTTRLMHVIAWLLNQRAVESGEMNPLDAARPERRLGDAPESDDELLPLLPDTARHIIDSSKDLYARVQRLDEGTAVIEPQPSPARSLLSHLQRAF
jgi:regulator of CtrA degradation